MQLHIRYRRLLHDDARVRLPEVIRSPSMRQGPHGEVDEIHKFHVPGHRRFLRRRDKQRRSDRVVVRLREVGQNL